MAAAGAADGLDIVFVAATTVSASTTSPTINKPSGVVDGDLMLMFIFNPDNAGTITTPPSGWTLLDSYLGSAYSGYTYYKFASSEGSSYTYTYNVGTGSRAIIVAYRNAELAVLSGGYDVDTGGICSTLDVTPIYDGYLVCAFAIEATGVSVSSGPSGMTSRASAGSSNIEVVYDQAVTKGSATGTKTTTFSVAASCLSVPVLIAKKSPPEPIFVTSSITKNTSSSSATALSIAKPTGTQTGDLLVAILSNVASIGGSWTQPSGWTEIADQGSNSRFSASYKIAGGSEGSSYSFTPSNSTAARASGIILLIRNAAYDSIGSVSSTATLSSVTVAAANSLLIAAASANSGSALGTPGGFLLLDGDTDLTTPDIVAFAKRADAGATGTVSVTNNTGGALISIS